MRVDLERLLDTIADRAAAQASPVPVDHVLGRLHRRRAVRTAAASGLAVAAVAAVGVATIALPRAAPVSPAHSTGPMPAPTPVWPTAVMIDGPAPECGDLMPALVHPGGDPEIVAEFARPGPLVTGEVAEIDITVSAPAVFEFQASHPEVLLVRDGLVAATNRGPGAPDGLLYGADSTLSWVGVTLDLTRCGSTGHNEPALDPGDYDAYAVIRLHADDQELAVVGGPVPLRLVETPWRLAEASAIPAGVPVIGEVLRVEVHADGDAWRFSTLLEDFGQDSYAVARDALVTAGFTVDTERADTDQPWNVDAVLRSLDHVVELSVANATGAGWYAHYVITRR